MRCLHCSHLTAWATNTYAAAAGSDALKTQSTDNAICALSGLGTPFISSQKGNNVPEYVKYFRIR